MLQARALGLALLLAAVVGCSSSDPYDSVCQINVPGSQGSGTLVKNGVAHSLVVTARHVGEHVGNKVKCRWHTGEVTEGVIVYVAPGDGFSSDISVALVARPKGIAAVHYRPFVPNRGPYRCVGYRDNEFYESVSSDAEEYDNTIRMNKPLIGGMSGGACFDGDDYYIGIGVGSNRTDTAISTDGTSLSTVMQAIDP